MIQVHVKVEYWRTFKSWIIDDHILFKLSTGTREYSQKIIEELTREIPNLCVDFWWGSSIEWINLVNLVEMIHNPSILQLVSLHYIELRLRTKT